MEKETVQAKIRNRLSPIKSLIEIVLALDNLPPDKEKPAWLLAKNTAQKTKDIFNELLSLVDATELPDEYILCSAIWYKELPLKHEEPLRLRGYSPYNIDRGVVLCGWRHSNCLYQMNGITGLKSHEAGKNESGFLTNKNRFVNREEGMKIAKAANQLNTDLHVSNILFSENLY